MNDSEKLERNKTINKKIMKFFTPIFAVLFIIVIICFITDKDKPKTKVQIAQEKKDSISEERTKKLDPILYGLEDIAKLKMRDPDSYDKIESDYDRSDTANVVRMFVKFRGNNAFGGKAVTTIVADYDIKKDYLEIKNQINE